MRSPILTFEGNDLMVFRSVPAAEAFVEPPDIAVFETYDAEGRLLAFETDGRRTFLREQESSASHGRQLREALLRVLGRCRRSCRSIGLTRRSRQRGSGSVPALTGASLKEHSRTIAHETALFLRARCREALCQSKLSVPPLGGTRCGGEARSRDDPRPGVLIMRRLIATVFNYSLDGLLADEGTEFWKFCFDLPEIREPDDAAQLDFSRARTRTSWAAPPTRPSPGP
jgi:hypothetical protein